MGLAKPSNFGVLDDMVSNSGLSKPRSAVLGYESTSTYLIFFHSLILTFGLSPPYFFQPPFPPVDPVLQRWVDISPIHAGTGIHAIDPQFVDAPLSWAHFFLPTNQTEFILFYARPKEITLDPKLPLKKKEAAAKSSPSKKWREHGQKKVLTRSESQRRNSIVEPRSPSLNAPSL
ncbi:uncharacterized protein RAG0_04525 [Rhynchosporium agropyri]|uniref:Uncharacterized protein n=1 Tax=Rhynchosporium agropyri TaxID=914238 RepID=A0A1E1K9A2_9HELO|nr:uncharacterized protein RAG0_04525 [Rhynchosporium agropyri]